MNAPVLTLTKENQHLEPNVHPEIPGFHYKLKLSRPFFEFYDYYPKLTPRVKISIQTRMAES
jgi:hypothetical protein